ncbi:MAG: GIY-YIG nuclease family protein [Acidimicrobiales bacterium]|nr:GIY-YIG nuclease family protein [Acidimicrobiales bacterium]
MNNGKSIKIFLVDGSAGGMLTAEIGNWTGHVIVTPRSVLQRLFEREESKRTGVYFLIGDYVNDDSTEETAVYIGESDNVGERLKKHALPVDRGGKDFWDRAIVLTSKDSNLTKAHARYLESRFISIAKQARRSVVTNGTDPDSISLPESDKSDMENFISEAQVLLPVLGVSVFRVIDPSRRSTGNISDTTFTPIFELSPSNRKVVAKMQIVDGEFVVLKGSTTTKTWTSVKTSYSGLRKKLEEDGILELSDDADVKRFVQDYAFSSPSAAAAVVLGRAANGRTEWKEPKTGLKLVEWENQNIG